MIKDIIKQHIEMLSGKIFPTATDGKQFERNVRSYAELQLLEYALGRINTHYNFIGRKVFKFENDFNYILSDGTIMEFKLKKINYSDEILFTDDMFNKYCFDLLNHHIEYYSYDLLERDIAKNSTYMLGNLIYTWEIEAKQNIIKFYKELIKK